MTRTFSIVPAVRERTPLLIGIVGPSSSGKTYSALRLAAGIQKVVGGDVGVIDTEARRALHYAGKFKFRHMSFGAPFGSLDYLDAITEMVNAGIKTVLVDSMSHEHEGSGGMLEAHEAALDKMAGQDYAKRNKMTMLAWAKPKAARRKLINAILQMDANFIFCFRAKEKIKMVPGKDPVALGFQAISGDEWIYEMQLKCLLLPGSDGVPTWQSEMPGEKLTIKLPEQFRPFFGKGQQLSEDIGEKLARWAAGDAAQTVATADDLVARFDACSDSATWRALNGLVSTSNSSLSADDKKRVKQAHVAAKARIEAAAALAALPPVGDEQDADDAGFDPGRRATRGGRRVMTVDDPADVTIGFLIKSALWCFWETEYPDDMVIGPFDTEEACRTGVEDFYKRNNPFASGATDYVITRVVRRDASWVLDGQVHNARKSAT